MFFAPGKIVYDVYRYFIYKTVGFDLIELKKIRATVNSILIRIGIGSIYFPRYIESCAYAPFIRERITKSQSVLTLPFTWFSSYTAVIRASREANAEFTCSRTFLLFFFSRA